MKFLIKETKYFVDGHGTPDEGETKKYITNKEIYQHTDPDEYYRSYELEYITNKFVSENSNKEIQEFFEEQVLVKNDDMCAQDGYNCKVCKFVVEQISEEKAEEIQNILEEYEKL